MEDCDVSCHIQRVQDSSPAASDGPAKQRGAPVSAENNVGSVNPQQLQGQHFHRPAVWPDKTAVEETKLAQLNSGSSLDVRKAHARDFALGRNSEY